MKEYLKQYHISVDGQPPSVVPGDVLAKEVAEGKYPESTLIWCAGMSGWEPIGKYFSLSATFLQDSVDVETAQEDSLRTKRPVHPLLKKLLLGLGGVGIVWIVLSAIVSPSGHPEQNELESAQAAASIMNDIRWYVGKEDWSRLFDTFQNSRNMEVVGKYYYHDGVERETPLELNDAQLHYRALYALWSSGQPSDVLSYGKLNDDIRDIEEKLRYAHSSETEQLQAALAQLQRTKSQRLMQYDVCRTKHLATFLTGGDANGELAAGIEQVGKICKANPGDETLAYYSRCLNDLRKSAELVSAAIPWECQLFIVDEYERDLREMSEWLDLALYCSPQELVDLRNRIRRLIRQKMKEGTR